MSSRSILLVAYFYPPCTDTGAQRPAAMVKWLRRLGHRVTVLTTSAYGSVEPGGELASATHRTADLQLLRARLAGQDRVGAMYDADTYSGRPHPLSRVVVPEPLLAAWGPFALAAAHRLARREHFDAVITTSPPETVHAIGRALRRRHGIPWIADIRDAWNFEPLRPRFPTRAQRRLDHALERRWLGAADVVVGVSEPAVADMRARLGIEETALITNGWDPEGEPAEIDRSPEDSPAGDGPRLDPARVSLVYTGRFGSYGRDPRGLLDGLARLAREDPEAAGRLELVVAGPLTEAERPLFERDVSPARIVLAGSLSRPEALALQRSADVLLLVAQPTRSQLLNFKLFEYVAAARPILALAEGTDAARVAREVGGEAVRADDPGAIARALGRVARGQLAAPSPAAADPYTYPGPAERMEKAVERAIERVKRA
ncbi:glycosyltransferase [Thermoleophilia bacterium SCSIO 60948]|nr:glycosyltransferase [Thermoleophilia bacterium SCSIO 60948]